MLLSRHLPVNRHVPVVYHSKSTNMFPSCISKANRLVPVVYHIIYNTLSAVIFFLQKCIVLFLELLFRVVSARRPVARSKARRTGEFDGGRLWQGCKSSSSQGCAAARESLRKLVRRTGEFEKIGVPPHTRVHENWCRYPTEERT